MLNRASFITSLPNLAIIEVLGEQRHDYLHGQLTVATKQFEKDVAKRAAHCDFKGKMFSALTLTEFNDSFLLSSEESAAKESLAQLKKYGVFSKVEISLNQNLKAYGAFGAEAIVLMKALFKELNETHLNVVSNEFGQVITFNDANLHYLAYLTETGQARLNDMYEMAVVDDHNLWDAIEIEAGIANVQAQTIGEFVPQMLNFQAIGAIDFDKGCYMGQEVVARTKFLGKNKRATFILEGDLNDSKVKADILQVGNNIEMQLGENWRRAGVVNRVSIVDGKVRLLAVMANDMQAGSMLRLKGSDLGLTLKPLPYELVT